MFGLGLGLTLSCGAVSGGVDPPFFVWPDASNTGARYATTPYDGPTTITVPGTLIERKAISGTLTIAADDVTVRDCVITGFGSWGILQDDINPVENTVIEYCTMDASGARGASALGVGGGASSVIRYNDLSGVTLGIQLFGTCHVHHNYIHDLISVSSNPDDRHFDGITIFAGSAGTLIENNSIHMPSEGTSAIFIANRFGVSIDDITVDHNRLVGAPSYTMYIENALGLGVNGVVVTDNIVNRGAFGWFGIVDTTINMSGNFDNVRSVFPGGQSPIVIQIPDQEPLTAAFTPSAALNTNDNNANISLRHVLVLDEAVPGAFRVAIHTATSGGEPNITKTSVGVSAGSGNTVGTPVELTFNGGGFPTTAANGLGFIALSDPVDLGPLADASSLVVIMDCAAGDNAQRFGSGNSNITTYFKTGATYNQATPGGLTHSSGNNFGVQGIFQ